MGEVPSEMQQSASGGRISLAERLAQLGAQAARLAVSPLQRVATGARLTRVPKSRLAAGAVFCFVLATGWAEHQYVAPFVWHAPYSVLSWKWWAHPIEWNLDAGLPAIAGDINAIIANDDASCLWIAGDAGLFFFSGDRGKNWTQLNYDTGTREFHAANGAQPCGPKTGPAAAASGWWLVPRAFAEAQSAGIPEQQQRAMQQQQAPQTQAAAPQSQSAALGKKDSSPQAPTNLQATVQTSPAERSTPSLKVFPPEVVFSTVRLNFGAAAAAFSRSSVQIQNALPVPVSISQVALSPSIFHLDGSAQDTCSDKLLKAGETCVVPLIFAPTEVGKFDGELHFYSSSRTQPWIVPLLATAEAGPASPASPGASPPGAGASSATKPAQAAPQTPNSTAPSPPDLWAFSMFGPKAAALVSADYYDYMRSQQGLVWRAAAAAIPSPGLLETTDRMIDFERDEPTGKYGIKSVAGWCCLDRPLAPIMRWDSSTRQFQIMNAAARLLRTIEPKVAGDFISLSVPSSSNSNDVWGIIFTSSPVVATSIVHSSDGGYTWSEAKNFPGEKLKSIHFQSDGKTGWVAGDHGVVLATTDAGATWQPLTSFGGRLLHLGKWDSPKESPEYVRFVPPWYILALLFCGVMASPVLFPVDKTETSDLPPAATKSPAMAGAGEADASTIGNQAVADKPLEPGDPDALGLGTIAAGLAFFLRNEKTKPPLAIAINGRWGSGKSSLMNLLKSNLESWGAHPVWFNAWHHQKEDQMLAALLQAVKSQAVPPVWEWAGLRFRCRLLWRRLQTKWFYLVLAGAVVFIVYKAEIFITNTLHVKTGALIEWIASLGKAPQGANDGKQAIENVGQNLAQKTRLLTILTGLAAAYRVLSGGLTAFGTNPAALLTSFSGTTNIKALDAQTSFRQQFASEFGDVTRSLGKNQRMLILIDDLDRCRPEKVREVLEGVNFLASSGDCFIVLGMARDIVEHCVGLSFARVVDTMSWESMGLTPRDIERALAEARRAGERRTQSGGEMGAASTKEDATFEACAKRHAFAHLYLDKLIQIEVTVPEPSPVQRRLLFRSEEEIKKDLDRKEQRVQEILDTARASYARAQPFFAIALVGLALFGCWALVRPTVRAWVTDLTVPSQGSPQGTSQNNSNTSPAGAAASGTSASTGTGGNLPARAATDKPGSGVASPSATNPPPNATAAASTAAPLEAAGISPFGPRTGTPEKPGVAIYHTNKFTTGWPFFLVLLGTVSVIATSLRRLPQRIVRDNAPFTNALAVWHPLVMTGGAKNTPRTARRFQNRVRYLAMRQRARLRGKATSLGERWLRDALRSPFPQLDQPVHLAENQDLDSGLAEQVKNVRALVEAGSGGECGEWKVSVATDRIDISGNGAMPGETFKALVLDNVYIPESVLIALAAIEEFAPEWLEDEDLFRGKVAEAGPAEPVGKSTLFKKTVEEHKRQFKNWYNLEPYRRAYIELCSELRQAGTAQN